MRNGGLASVRRHCHRDRAPIALHLQGDPPEPGARAWTARNLPAQPDRTSAPTPVGALATATSGLKATASRTLLRRSLGVGSPISTPRRRLGARDARDAAGVFLALARCL